MGAAQGSAPGADYLLVRVDDRLLHGQVVLGWGRVLDPRAYLILDDRAAADAWEREAYEAAAPHGVGVQVRGLAAPVALDPATTVVLLRDLDGLQAVLARGWRPRRGINLGGIHAHDGSRELLPYLHLTAAEERRLSAWLDDGVALYAQDLPTAPRLDARALRGLLLQGS